jgi:TetR/AcrR family transcriptional regulator
MLRPNQRPPTTPPATSDPEPAEAGGRAALPAQIDGRRERNAAATKLRLLDAAEREFAQRGFAGARLREIADGAGVQPALIHHYFVDKQGLYRAVLDRALAPTSTESWNLLETRHDIESLLSGFIELLIRLYAAHQNLLAILRHESIGGSPILIDVIRERTMPILEAAGAFLVDRQQAGEIRADMTAQELMTLAISMVMYPFVESGLVDTLMPQVALKDEAALERRKQVIVSLFMNGIRPQKAATSR